MGTPRADDAEVEFAWRFNQRLKNNLPESSQYKIPRYGAYLPSC
jgi:hypothetical protein